jgi:glucokinase
MYIGVDVGGTNLKAARIDAQGVILEQRHEPVVKTSAEELFDQLERVVRDLTGSVPPAALGVGVPGIISRDGRVHAAPNLSVLDGRRVPDEMDRRLGLKTFVENDANAAALAEAWIGAGRGADYLLFITLGTGVGGGIVFGGRIWSGCSGYAGELGHMQVEENGQRCNCGARGCLETLAGAAGWTRLAETRINAGRASSLRDVPLDPKTIAQAARAGDAVALEVCDEVGRAMGIGISAALLLMNMERVVIGGGIARAGNVLLDPIIRHVRKRIFPELFNAGMVRLAEAGSDAGVIGAARVAMLAAMTPTPTSV